MNYLAHVFLSHETPAAVTGAMLGDFVKGGLPPAWNAEVCAAIALHRAIDRFTDRHVVVAASRRLVSPARRRFAGILVDLFFDHFLARNWRRYHGQPLPEFAQEVYAVLLPQRARFPERLQRIVPLMAQDDWLSSYAEVSAIDAALNGLARRFRYPERARVLTTAIDELEGNYARFERYFLQFFPVLRQFVKEYAEGTPGRGTQVRDRVPPYLGAVSAWAWPSRRLS